VPSGGVFTLASVPRGLTTRLALSPPAPFNGAMTLALRPFRDADYSAFTELCNRYRPVVAQSKAALRAFDEAYKGDLLLDLVDGG